MGEEKDIDLQKLSQRELLIVTHNKVEEIAKNLSVTSEKQAKHEVRISLVEQRVMIWGAVFGGAAGIITTIIVSLINH